MENRTIEEIIDGFCTLMLQKNYRTKTVFEYKQKYFISIQKFFHKNNELVYSSIVIDDFINSRLSKVKNGTLTLNHFKVIERNALLIKNYAEGNDVDFKKTHSKIYCPSSDSMEIVQRIIESEFSDGISRQCSAILRHFFCYLESRKITFYKVTDQTFLDFLTYVSKINKNSQCYVLKTLKAISNFAVKKYHLKLSINFSYWRPKRNRKRVIEPFSKEEIKKIVQQAKENPLTGKRDVAIIILAYSTGLRSVDISNLTFGDIDWINKSIKINQRKTSVPLQLPLNDITIKLMSDYILKERPVSSEPYIFLTSKTPYRKMHECWSLDSMLRKYYKSADIKVKSWQSMHSLRRAFASELSTKDIPLTTISQLLGHQDLDSDKPYLTYNIDKTMQCVISFTEIPLKSPVYSKDGVSC